jgi:hypothetical protein
VGKVRDFFLQALATGAVTTVLLGVAGFLGKSLIGQWLAKIMVDYEMKAGTVAHGQRVAISRLDAERAAAADEIAAAYRPVEALLSNDPSKWDGPQRVSWIQDAGKWAYEISEELEKVTGVHEKHRVLLAEFSDGGHLFLYRIRIGEGLNAYLEELSEVELRDDLEVMRRQLRAAYARSFENNELKEASKLYLNTLRRLKGLAPLD